MTSSRNRLSVCRSENSVKRSIEMFVPNYFTILQTNSNDNLYYFVFFAESNGYDIIPYSWKQKFSR